MAAMTLLSILYQFIEHTLGVYRLEYKHIGQSLETYNF